MSKTILEENMEIYLKSEERRIRFNVILYLIVLISFCIVIIYFEYTAMQETKLNEVKTLNQMDKDLDSKKSEMK
ncbi:MAG: hypothetical protein L6Q54_11450 [Leptospiraceae bacterium]|nr:hypothetical protein [Leptospiraceae bacterium]MCK6381843.1 hypothetical protein [Leptospiraceae bacterium]NUM42602.1 hypothetical protein [Leptospiraceae bacterium]